MEFRRSFGALSVVFLLFGASTLPSAAATSSGAQKGQLVYSCDVGAKNADLEICLVPAGGGKDDQATKNVSTAVGPEFSPDGSHVAFLCYWSRSSANFTMPVRDLVDFGPAGFHRNTTGDVCVFTSDRSDIKALTEDGQSQPPAWSPDSKMLAFAKGGGPVTIDASGSGEATVTQPPVGIWIIGAEGDGLRQLTTSADDFPDWSPDGTRIVLTRENRLVVVDATTGADVAQLTDGSTGIDLGATWSPDGKQLAFTRYLSAEPTFEVWVMNPDGSGSKKLASYATPFDANTGFDFTPHWSPDGTRLAFTGSTGSGSSMFATVAVVPVAGGKVLSLGPKPKSKKAYGSLLPAWSPDGTSIAFVSDYQTNKTFELYTMASDGSGLRRITKDANEEFAPDWGPSTG